MIRVYKIVALLIIGFTFMACPSDDSPSSEPLRDYQEVYNEEIVEIENFLDTHYVTVDADFNTTFTEIPDGGTQTPISEMPELTHLPVTLNDVDYKVYYLKLNDGINENPTAIDSVYSSYKGQLLDKTIFDHASTPIWFKLEEVIPAWGKIFPLFKTGDYVENPSTGLVTYSGYGAGVMFVPSGLGYYNIEKALIPAYSPLIFTFSLKRLRYRDHDGDKILSKYEYGPDLSEEAIDTDGDDYYDYLDVDDDADGVLTKEEIKFTYLDGTVTKTAYYPYTGKSTDDPLTPYDDRRGIPRKFTGPIIPPSTLPSPSSDDSDFTDPTRLRRHLDKTCKPPYTN